MFSGCAEVNLPECAQWEMQQFTYYLDVISPNNGIVCKNSIFCCLMIKCVLCCLFRQGPCQVLPSGHSQLPPPPRDHAPGGGGGREGGAIKTVLLTRSYRPGRY